MAQPISLDLQITGLVPEVDDAAREALQTALRTLRAAHNLAGAILTVSRFLEGEAGFLARVAAAAGTALTGDTLAGHITRLSKEGAIPQEIAADLDAVRVRANKARHNAEQSRLTPGDAEMVLGRGLRVVEWFYCECAAGPRLAVVTAAALLGNWRHALPQYHVTLRLAEDRAFAWDLGGTWTSWALGALAGGGLRGRWAIEGNRLHFRDVQVTRGFSGWVNPVVAALLAAVEKTRELPALRLVRVDAATLVTEGGELGEATWNRV